MWNNSRITTRKIENSKIVMQWSEIELLQSWRHYAHHMITDKIMQSSRIILQKWGLWKHRYHWSREATQH